MKIGVLCVQGAFAEHIAMLRALGTSPFEIRQKEHLKDSFDGLILPGGESTVMGKLLRDLDLFDPLDQMIRSGLPVFGTCAGLLLLAGRIENDQRIYFQAMNLTARRNAYGRQLGSFNRTAPVEGVGDFPMVFIRAPIIKEVGDGCQALAQVDANIVAARQGPLLVTAFHPELTGNPSMHRYFLEQVAK